MSASYNTLTIYGATAGRTKYTVTVSAAVQDIFGQKLGKAAGLTFETQKYPGSPNFAHFPSTRLDPGQVYEHVMEYQFFAR